MVANLIRSMSYGVATAAGVETINREFHLNIDINTLIVIAGLVGQFFYYSRMVNRLIQRVDKVTEEQTIHLKEFHSRREGK